MAFLSFHPAVSAVYLVSVLMITMFCPNPIFALLSLLGGMLYLINCEKSKSLFKELGFYFLVFIVIAASNPLFSHKGKTVLFVINSNPVTLEAFLYGVNSALMLIAVIIWFKNLNRVLTEDKILFLFGRFSPKIALLISSALRFIPLLRAQGEKIKTSQKAMGLFASDSISDRLRGILRTFSALITWSLENAIDTAASMKSRGYGLKGRSCYSVYSFKKRDALLIAAIAVLDFITAFAVALNQLSFVFYPSVSYSPINFVNTAASVAFALLCMMPLIIEIKEGLAWKFYISKI